MKFILFMKNGEPVASMPELVYCPSGVPPMLFSFLHSAEYSSKERLGDCVGLVVEKIVDGINWRIEWHPKR